MGALTGRNIALTGVPRSGTTLACQLLSHAENTVALFEPMDIAEIPTAPRSACVEHIEAFMATVRRQVLDTGTAPSKQRGGTVPDNLFAPTDAAGQRAAQAALGRVAVTVNDPGFTLVIKHNAMFTAVLPALATRVETFAIVRNPLAVLGSWNSVDLPVRDGRIPAGERLDPSLAHRLECEADVLERQLIVLDWFFSQYATHLPRERVLAYEDIVATQGQLLFDRLGVRGAAGHALRERNAGIDYPREGIERCADALRARDGAWSAWYDCDAIDGLHARMADSEQP